VPGKGYRSHNHTQKFRVRISVRSAGGIVSLTCGGETNLRSGAQSPGRDRIAPLVGGLGSEDAERRARDEMALVERFRPTIIGGTPTSLVALLNIPTSGADLSSLRFCFTGAALLSATLSDAFAKHVGVRVHQAYGMTECAGLITAAGAHTAPIAGTVGSAPSVSSDRLRTSALDRIANSRSLNRSVGDTKRHPQGSPPNHGSRSHGELWVQQGRPVMAIAVPVPRECNPPTA
jgi:acyl-CoA synthetase (AMP-forming)/AMP-acid ligase II